MDRSLEAMVSIAGGWPGELNLGPGGWPGELNLGPHQNRSADLTWGAAPLCLSRVRGLTFPRLLLGRSDFGSQRIDADQPCCSRRVMRPAAPRPVFGMHDQAALNWITVHIVQLLQNLFAPHIKIVEAALPECRSFRHRSTER